MDELLTEEFTIQFDNAMQNEFERFVAEVGENILRQISATEKEKATGKLFVGQTPLAKQETLIWQIDPQVVPMIWEVATNDFGLAPTEEKGVRFDVSLAESEDGKQLAWFALRDKYNGAKTPTFSRFVFALTDYLKPRGIAIKCRLHRKLPDTVEIKYKKVK